MDYKDIPRFPHSSYEIDVQWPYIEGHLKDCISDGLDLDPDYQRGHVWTQAQQIAFVEFCLMGGEVGRTIIVNAPAWNNGSSYKGSTLVDGKQRLEAVRKFIRDELPIFGGHTRSQIKGELRMFMGRFKWRVVALKTREDVLRLYLSLNAGGTPHAAEEIERVRAMLRDK